MGRSDQRSARACDWLTRDEFEWAYRLGREIALAASQQPGRRPHRGEWKPTLAKALRVNGLAKAAELLASKMTGRAMLSLGFVPDKTKPDLVGGVEVRHTKHLVECMLYCWPDPKDPPERVYVCIAGTHYSNLECRGWNLGTWVKQPRFFRRKGEILIGSYRARDDGFWAPESTLHDPTLERLQVREGESDAAFVQRMASSIDLCQYVGRGAFGIRYDERGHALP